MCQGEYWPHIVAVYTWHSTKLDGALPAEKLLLSQPIVHARLTPENPYALELEFCLSGTLRLGVSVVNVPGPRILRAGVGYSHYLSSATL